METTIRWEGPSETNGILIGFNLTIGIAGQIGSSQKINSTTPTSFIYSVPTLCRIYTVRITALTEKGSGPIKEADFTATAPGFSSWILIFKYFKVHVNWIPSLNRKNCHLLKVAESPQNVRIERHTDPQNLSLTVRWDPPLGPGNFVNDCSPVYSVSLFSSATGTNQSVVLNGKI